MFKFRKHKIKTPTILQMEAAECGAAALSIILAHYGRYISLEEMRVDCAVSRDGCSAINILQAARHHGMIAQAAKVEEPEALHELTLPLIIFWEFNHFVVLEGIGKNKFYINDPAAGARTIDYEEFNRAFTGIILAVEPGPDFNREGEPPSIFHGFAKRVRGSSRDLLFVILASLALVIPNLILPGLIKIFVDNIIIENLRGWLLPFFSFFIVTTIVFGILYWFQQYYLLRLRVKFLLVNSVAFLWHVICLPIRFFQQRYAGDVSERIAANDRIADLLSNKLSTALVGIISVIFYAIVIFLISWQLTLIGIAALLINFLIYFSIARKYADTSRNFLQQNGKLSGFEMNGLYIIEDLKANGRENDFFQRWAGMHAKIITLQHKQALYSLLLTIAPSWSVMISTAVILGYGSILVMQGTLTIGSLIAFQLLLANFTAPFYTLLSFGEEIQEIKGDFARLDDVNNYAVDKRLIIPSSTFILDPTVELKNINFSYSPFAHPILKNIDLRIGVGEQVAIIGKTGGGKSTIAKIIAGLYLPLEGEVLIGDVPLEKISTDNLAKILGFVDQDIFLYSGTVKDNLTLWNKDISDTAIETALKDACMHDVIMEKGGIYIPVLEGGANFSGGQKQRLEIARALVTDPKILILDEATSNLDAENERNILSNIKKRGCTTLIITHRLDALNNCNRIYKLDRGRLIVESLHGRSHGQ